MATHLVPWHGLTGGKNPGVSPLSLALELRLVLFLLGFLDDGFQDETVSSASGPLGRASDTRLERLR
jgi:hypothetical protein